MNLECYKKYNLNLQLNKTYWGEPFIIIPSDIRLERIASIKIFHENELVYEVKDAKFYTNFDIDYCFEEDVKTVDVEILCSKEPRFTRAVCYLDGNYDYLTLTDEEWKSDRFSNFRVCEECGDLFEIDPEEPNITLCNGCIRSYFLEDEHVDYYSYTPQGNDPIVDYPWYGFGIELEFDGERISDAKVKKLYDKYSVYKIGSDRYHWFFLATDGSLCNGYELDTEPMTEKLFYQLPWENLLSDIKKSGGDNQHPTAGMHIHFSREYFGETEDVQNNAIAKIVYFHNKYYYDILKLSGRTNVGRYFQLNDFFDNRKSILNSGYYNLENWTEELIDAIEDRESSHYDCVSFEPSDTVEFRIMASTLDIEDFYARVEFLLGLVKASTQISWADLDNQSEWFQFMTPRALNLCKKYKTFEDIVYDKNLIFNKEFSPLDNIMNKQ